jgi:hypothetical protein
VLALFVWDGFYDLFFPTFFLNPRKISVGAFSGVGNAKTRGSSPEMSKTGSPLAKDELASVGMMVVTRGRTWEFDARKSQRYILPLELECDKNGQSKRTGYL